jgi:hypothetical protein
MSLVTYALKSLNNQYLGTYREATLGDMRLHHNIYSNRINFEVRHVALDADGVSLQEPKEEIINAITTEAGVRKLEFYLRDSVTGQRKSWIVLKAACLRSMTLCIERAQTLH